MDKNMIELYRLFQEISQQGFIKNPYSKARGGVGMLFENLIGKRNENLPLPDFGNIEIKTFVVGSPFPITLFHAAPNGDDTYEIRRLRNLYGYPDWQFPECNVLRTDVNARYVKKMGYSNYYFSLEVDWEQQKVYLPIYDNNKTLLEREISWSFEYLKERVYQKLRTVAMVYAIRRYTHNQEYFHYKAMLFYRLKDFYTFLTLIQNGIIEICFNIDVYREGKKQQEIYDHGTAFRINCQYLDKLFDVVKMPK